MLLANFGKEGRPEPIIAKIHEVLAEMIGTTRSRVSHFMNKFRELGFIDYNGHLEVHRSLLGVVLNEKPFDVSIGGSPEMPFTLYRLLFRDGRNSRRQHPDFDRYQATYPRRSESQQNCYSRDGDERSAVPAGV